MNSQAAETGRGGTPGSSVIPGKPVREVAGRRRNIIAGVPGVCGGVSLLDVGLPTCPPNALRALTIRVDFSGLRWVTYGFSPSPFRTTVLAFFTLHYGCPFR